MVTFGTGVHRLTQTGRKTSFDPAVMRFWNE